MDKALEGSERTVYTLWDRERFDNCLGYFHREDNGCSVCSILASCRRIKWVIEPGGRLPCFGAWKASDVGCLLCVDLALCRGECWRGRYNNG